MKKIIDNRELECELTQEDRNSYTDDLTKAILEKQEVEEEKKQTVKAYNKDIKAWGKKINALGAKLNNGYETRMISCEVRYNHPEYGRKTIIRQDTYERWIEKMSDEEFNLFTNGPSEEEPDSGRSASIKSMMS